MTPTDILEPTLELPVVEPEILLFVTDTLPVPTEVVLFVADALLLEELVPLPPPDLPGLLSNVSSSPITPPSPRTYDHVRVVALTTVSLLNP